MFGNVLSAWLDIRTQPLRAIVAVAGMVVAVVVVVVVDAASVFSRDANAAYLARQYGLPVTALIYSDSAHANQAASNRLSATLSANGISEVSPDLNVPTTVVYQGETVFSGVRWLNSRYRDIRIVDVVAGSWPTDTARSDVLHVVLSEGWASDALGVSDQEVVGQVLWYAPRVTGSFDPRTSPVRPMIVDGVVSTKTLAFASGSSPIAIVTDRPQLDLAGTTTSMTWVARVNPSDYQLLVDLVASIVDEQGQRLFSVTRADQGDHLAPVLQQQARTGRFMTVVALAIGGLGILGVGLAGVRERAREFGLKRALGSSTAGVFRGVLILSLIQAVLAALIAVPLAAVFVELFARDMVIPELPLSTSTALPLRSAVLGTSGAVGVGFVAGLVPAVSAARLSVVQALRA